MKLSGVNTIDRGDVQANGQGQRSMVKVTEVKTQFSHFLTITPVWIHIWRWNDAQSLMWQRIGALLFFKVIHQISGHTGQKITNFDSNWAFLDCNTSLNSLMAMKWCTCKAWRSVEEVPYYFLRSSIKFEDHPGPENCRFESNLINITRPVTAIKSLRLALFF